MGQGKQSYCKYIFRPIKDYGDVSSGDRSFIPLRIYPCDLSPTPTRALIETMLFKDKDLYLGDLLPRGKAFS